jgi:hypothetical protein
MSKMCGDTARFHRISKQRRIKRARAQELLRSVNAAGKSLPAAVVDKPKP